MNEIVVLHVSDLHFGIENDKSDKTKYVRPRQKEMIHSLIETIRQIIKESPEWCPNVVAISGDVAWSGKNEEYKLYKEYFVLPLCEMLGISENYVITCPGNHDIIRDKVKRVARYAKEVIGKDPDIPELNREETIEQAYYFEEYVNELCEGDSEKLCQSITFEEWPWITFLTLNSAWDCRNDDDEGRLRVGLPILEELVESTPDNNCVITLFHHPHTEIEDMVEKIDGLSHQKVLDTIKRQWLHITERKPDLVGGRTFCSYVEEKSTYILNGHIHKETEPQKLGKSIRLISGTVYSNDTPRYHCRLLKISNKSKALYRDLRHTIGDRDENWEVTTPKQFQFEHAFSIIIKKNEQAQRDLSLGQRLQELTRQYEKNKNIEEYIKSVGRITRELLNEDIADNNQLNEKEVMDSTKNTVLEDLHIYSLGKGGEI